MIQQFSSEYDYCAFISFSSNDAKIANWLKDRLDRFNIPSFIRREHGLEIKRLKPSYTYLHASEAGKELKNELEKKLKRSRFLIVVCSPNSAKSLICDWEIATFIKLGRRDYIIPIIVDGLPYSDDENTECLSPSIHKEFPKSSEFVNDKEIKCANLHEKGIPFYEQKDHAFAQIVARILDVNSDAIWSNIHHKNQLKYSLCAVILFAFSFLGVSIYDYYSTSFTYFVDYVDCNGIPNGIMPIKEGDLYNHSSHYRFESSEGKLDRVVYCNSHGQLLDHGDTELTDRPSIIELGYDSDGGLTVTKRDRDGMLLYKEVVSPNRLRIDLKTNEANDAATIIGATTALFATKNNASSGGAFNVWDFSRNAKSEITLYTLERDTCGYITKQLFKKINGARLQPVKDLSGIFGMAYERDTLGRVIKLCFLGKDGNEMVENHQGIAFKTYKYNEQGLISETKYYNKQGELAINEMGWAVCRLKITDDYQIHEETYFDENGEFNF